jgi:hypothetical protein
VVIRPPLANISKRNIIKAPMKEIFLVKESLELSLLKKYRIEKRKEKIPKRPKYEILKNSFIRLPCE